MLLDYMINIEIKLVLLLVGSMLILGMKLGFKSHLNVEYRIH